MSVLVYSEKMKLIVAIVGSNEITVLMFHSTSKPAMTDVDYFTSMCTVGGLGLAGRGEKRNNYWIMN